MRRISLFVLVAALASTTVGIRGQQAKPKGAEWPLGSLSRNPHWMTCADPDAEHFRKTRVEGGRSPKTSEEDQRRIEQFLQQKRGRER